MERIEVSAALLAEWVVFWLVIFYRLVLLEDIWGGMVNGLNRFGYWTGKAIGRAFYALRWPR